jgi:hypothetical protein
MENSAATTSTIKIKKTMSEKALAANRANAQKSTGPTNCGTVSQNARQHGLLADKIVFESDEEKQDFGQLVHDVRQDRQPVGVIEEALVEEVAVSLWKLRAANGWEIQEVKNRRASSEAVMHTISESRNQERLPLFSQWGTGSDARLGWECQELVVRSGARDSKESFGNKTEGGNVQFEMKLTASLESVLRYQAAIKRDLFRLLDALERLQEARRGEV